MLGAPRCILFDGLALLTWYLEQSMGGTADGFSTPERGNEAWPKGRMASSRKCAVLSAFSLNRCLFLGREHKRPFRAVLTTAIWREIFPHNSRASAFHHCNGDCPLKQSGASAPADCSTAILFTTTNIVSAPSPSSTNSTLQQV